MKRLCVSTTRAVLRVVLAAPPIPNRHGCSLHVWAVAIVLKVAGGEKALHDATEPPEVQASKDTPAKAATISRRIGLA